GFAIVPEDHALSAVAVRDEEVDEAITVEVFGDDDCGRLGGERRACGEGTLAIVETEIAGTWVVRKGAAIRDEDIRAVVAIYVRQSDVSRCPTGVAESS